MQAGRQPGRRPARTAGAPVANLEHRAPHGEAGALLIVLGAALAQVINALCLCLSVSARQGHHALVHLQAAGTQAAGNRQRKGNPRRQEMLFRNKANIQNNPKQGRCTSLWQLWWQHPQFSRRGQRSGLPLAASLDRSPQPCGAACLDARDDSLALEQLHKGLALAGVLIESLLEKDLQ